MRKWSVFACLLYFSTAVANAQPGDTLKPGMYIYNKARDTIRFDPLSVGRFVSCSVQLTDSIQVNGKGAKELVFLRRCSGSINEHGGTFDITEYKAISRYEVWDTDTKTLLFTAMNSYFYSYDIFRAYGGMNTKKGTDWYDYQFSIDNTGKITITELPVGKMINQPVREPVMKVSPDHPYGTYIYSGGSYQRADR